MTYQIPQPEKADLRDTMSKAQVIIFWKLQRFASPQTRKPANPHILRPLSQPLYSWTTRLGNPGAYHRPSPNQPSYNFKAAYRSPAQFPVSTSSTKNAIFTASHHCRRRPLGPRNGRLLRSVWPHSYSPRTSAGTRRDRRRSPNNPQFLKAVQSLGSARVDMAAVR